MANFINFINVSTYTPAHIELGNLPVIGRFKAVVYGPAALPTPTAAETDWWHLATSSSWLIMEGYDPSKDEPEAGAGIRANATISRRNATEEYTSSKVLRDKARHGKAKNKTYNGGGNAAVTRLYKRVLARKRRKCFVDTSKSGRWLFTSPDVLFFDW